MTVVHGCVEYVDDFGVMSKKYVSALIQVDKMCSVDELAQVKCRVCVSEVDQVGKVDRKCRVCVNEVAQVDKVDRKCRVCVNEVAQVDKVDRKCRVCVNEVAQVGKVDRKCRVCVDALTVEVAQVSEMQKE